MIWTDGFLLYLLDGSGILSNSSLCGAEVILFYSVLNWIGRFALRSLRRALPPRPTRQSDDCQASNDGPQFFLQKPAPFCKLSVSLGFSATLTSLLLFLSFSQTFALLLLHIPATLFCLLSDTIRGIIQSLVL